MKRGFSLIELSVVLTIAGLLMASYLQYYTAIMQKQRYETTRQRMKEVRTALNIYSATHLRLPCPGSPGEIPDKVRRRSKGGLATERIPEDDDVCAKDAVAGPGVMVFKGDGDGSNQVWIGALPIQELRLEGDQGIDGWGNRFTYAVSRKLTLPEGMHDNPLPHGSISVVDQFGKNALDVADSGRWLLLSHGPSGVGAWTSAGGRRDCSGKTLDFENCNGDAKFIMAPFSRKAGKWFFDDLVIHDDADAGGSILDKLIVCNGKRKFYSPGDNLADKDGCMGYQNVWRGACVQSATFTEGGQWLKQPAIVLMLPAITSNGDCACKGYRSVEVGAWDDGARSPVAGGSNVSFVDTNGKPVEGIITPYVGGDKPTNTRTSLYTCVE